MSIETIALTDTLYDYYRNVGYREPKILRELREFTQKLSMARMQICPEQGQLMSLLIQLMQAKKTLDVGTFTGYSALAVALALPNDGKVYACDTSDEWTMIAKKFWQSAGVDNKIELHLAPALDTLQKLSDSGHNNTFDFVFIDADKNNYPQYYELALQLLKPGGLVAIDNVLWSGKVAEKQPTDKSTQTLIELNAFIHKDQRVSLSMLPIGDGLTLACKR